MKRQIEVQHWQLGHSEQVDSPVQEVIEASVPGLVQLDVAKAKGMPSLYQGNHEEEYRWMEDRYWHYTATVEVEYTEERPVLCLQSVDYHGEIRINGEKKLFHEGLFTPAELDLSPWKGQKVLLEVVLYPVPKRPGYEWKRGCGRESSASCKPAFSYGWDWCPRFATIGLCGKVVVEYRSKAAILCPEISYRLSDALDRADITVAFSSKTQGALQVTLRDEEGNEVLCRQVDSFDGKTTLSLDNPRLWWPNGQGEQAVYEIQLCHRVGDDTDIHTKKIGFRRVRLLTNQGAWGDQPYRQQTQTKFPMQLEINGRKIFVKDSNWVPPEMGYCQIDPQRTECQIRYLNEAHMNLMRIWGGGFVYEDDFYDLCDRYGIMVWQEFPLSCADYSDEDHYLEVLRKEASTAIRRLRIHPCLALWCGGNELFCAWSGMTPQALSLRLLDGLCLELDPFTPFLPTAPMYGAGHGVYSMVKDVPDYRIPPEHLTLLCESRCTAYTEFGCGAPSEWDYLQTFMTEEELNQPIRTGAVWMARHNQWFNPEAIRMLSQCENNLHAIVDEGVTIQARMYGMLFEEARRQQPFCSMAVNWCYNEPWPTAAGNGLISYPHRRKPAYYAVQNALRDQKLSLRFKKISWSKSEEIVCTAWVLNDSNQPIPAGTAKVILSVDGQEQEMGSWSYGEVAPRTNREGLKLSFHLSQARGKEFTVRIEGEEGSLSDSYTLYLTLP